MLNFDTEFYYDIDTNTYRAESTLTEETKKFILDNWDEISEKTGIDSFEEFLEKLREEIKESMTKAIKTEQERWARYDNT